MTAERVRRWPKRGCLWRREAIAAFARTGSYTDAARAVGTSRRAISRLAEKDEAFRRALDEALNIYVDHLEEEVDRRAFDGVVRDVFQGGKKVGEVREYSDRLAELRLKALRPEVYSDRPPKGSRSAEIRVVLRPPRSGDDGVPPAARPQLPPKRDPEK